MVEGIVQSDSAKTYTGKEQSGVPASEAGEERLKKIASRLFGGNKARPKNTA